MTVMIGGRVGHALVVVVLTEQLVDAEALLELDLLLLAGIDEADGGAELGGEQLDHVVGQRLRGRDHLALLHEEPDDVGRVAVELGADLLGRGRPLDHDLALGHRRFLGGEAGRLERLQLFAVATTAASPTLRGTATATGTTTTATGSTAGAGAATGLGGRGRVADGTGTAAGRAVARAAGSGARDRGRRRRAGAGWACRCARPWAPEAAGSACRRRSAAASWRRAWRRGRTERPAGGAARPRTARAGWAASGQPRAAWARPTGAWEPTSRRRAPRRVSPAPRPGRRRAAAWGPRTAAWARPPVREAWPGRRAPALRAAGAEPRRHWTGRPWWAAPPAGGASSSRTAAWARPAWGPRPPGAASATPDGRRRTRRARAWAAAAWASPRPCW